LFVLSPLAVPAYGSRLVAEVNARLVTATVRWAMWRLGFRRPIHYAFHPAAGWVAGRLDEERIIYHCVDEYSGFAGAGEHIRALEERLLARAYLVIVCSQSLFERKRAARGATVLVRHC